MVYINIERFVPAIFKNLYKSDGTMFESLLRPEGKILKGRWNIDYDKTILDRKVYLTNMDNCGCCGDLKTVNIPVKIYDDENILKYYVL